MCSQSAPLAIMRLHSDDRSDRSLARTEGEMIPLTIVSVESGYWTQWSRTVDIYGRLMTSAHRSASARGGIYPIPRVMLPPKMLKVETFGGQLNTLHHAAVG